jgi:glycosyltransferase involved in cell wall biosynthesis
VDQEPCPRIAVAIPCYNEAPAIGTVIEQFRVALPGAEIVVFDNNSTDGTAEVARGLGARVEPVPAQGKGHVVREAFTLLGDRDVLVLVDGDGTYPAEAAPLLVAPVLDGMADMAVGARQPEPGAGAMSPVRGLGNLLIRSAFRILIGPGTGDLLSGYRAFGPKFLHAVDLRSEGFEIETELAIAAVTHKLRALEVSVPYRPRIAGTVSKLNAFRDGRRILRTILVQSVRRNATRVIVASWVLLIVSSLPFRGTSWIIDVRVILMMISGIGFLAWAALLHRKASQSPRPAEVEKR